MLIGMLMLGARASPHVAAATTLSTSSGGRHGGRGSGLTQERHRHITNSAYYRYACFLVGALSVFSGPVNCLDFLWVNQVRCFGLWMFTGVRMRPSLQRPPPLWRSHDPEASLHALLALL
jgi:hypothetical protein